AKRFASIRLSRLYKEIGWPTGANPYRPDPTALSAQSYLLRPQGQLRCDNSEGVVTDLSIRSANGKMRYFRFHRLVEDPSGGDDSPGYFLAASSFSATYRPMASRWFVPYAWQGYSRTPGTDYQPDLAFPPDLSQPRFIVFVDEFDSYASMTSMDAYDALTGIKPGQIARRMFEINASGVVLKERTWQFTPDGTLVNGKGLGEEYIY